jgi:HK97 family phage prohead protease
MRTKITARVEWKAGADPGGLEGYASVFGNVDEVGDVVMPGAFKRTIDHWRKSAQPMPLIADHKMSTDGVIGSISDLQEDTRGLRFKARFSRSDKAQQVRTDILDGHIRGTSFTYEVMRSSPGHGDIDGKAVGRFLDELRLFEVTISPFPINQLAGVTSAKAVIDNPWDGDEARFSAEQWRRSCLIDTGQGDIDSKARYKLPVREPEGELNSNALGSASGALADARGGLADLSAALRQKAARSLITLYGDAEAEPPDAILTMAGAGSASMADWLESMGHAVAIKNPYARKAAIDELVASYDPGGTDLAPGTGDAPATATDATADGGSTPDDAYAVSFLTGLSDGTPTGDPPNALPGPLAVLDKERSNAEIDALAAEFQSAMED